MSIDRENFKTQLRCTDEQLDELIQIYNGFGANGIHGNFADFANSVTRVIRPTTADIEWATNLLKEIDGE